MDISDKRDDIRREMRKILASLDDRWVKAASNEICEKLAELIDNVIYHDIEHILAWTHFFPGEINLTSFISRYLEKCQIYLPRSLPDGSMTFISIGQNWLDSVETGVMGIPEPKASSGTLYDLSAAPNTVVLVPGLAFDRHGNRLGRGRGFYDRFLGQEGAKEIVKIGVMWTFQLLDEVSVAPHDIPVNWLCNEEQSLPADLGI